MTILPHKGKKTQKGDRHGVQHTSRQSGSHGHRLSNVESRKVMQASTGPVATIRNTNVKLSKNAEPTDESSNEENHCLGNERIESPPCNSDDERGVGFSDDELETVFEESLRRRGLIIKKMQSDGACLFRAVADQIYGDEEMHEDVRRLCLDYMEKNRDHFAQFVTEDFSEYLARKRCRHEHGNHVELQAISEIFSRPIEIYEYQTEPHNISSIRMEKCSANQPNAPIRLSYHGLTHYNSVVDPNAATIGVGLGLPGYSPGSADRDLLQKVVQKSEAELIEDTMLNDKIQMTDFERTEEELSQQVAQQSYMEFMQNMRMKNDGKHNKCGAKSVEKLQPQPGCSRDTLDDGKEGDRTDQSIWVNAASSDAEESALLAQVMALSQQEFLNSLKQTENGGTDSNQAGSSKSIGF